ncbi:MAG TPA: SH3 domain-containing protein [Verrucomicrobiae bacterium]|jgi:uncharacterized protein YgiM (DUF1202 family)
MKTISWTILGAMLATSVIAQDNTNTLPAIPAPATSPAMETAPAQVSPPPVVTADTNTAPVVKPKHKRVVRHKIKEPTVTLVPGTATVASGHVNVRGQAGVNGEVIAHVFKGDSVTVLDEINLKKHASDEPAQWAKIAYPTNALVWVNAKFVDTNNTVTTKKLNLRAGPGENFSVVGVLNSGDSVTPIETKGRWIKIQPPTNCFAFVAAMYLAQTAPTTETVATAQSTQTEVEPTPTPVNEPQPIITGQNSPPPAPVPPAENAPVPVTPETMPAITYDSNLPRVVSHEGVVRHVMSLITPTAYELYSPLSNQNIDFLYTTSTNLDLSKYINMDIIVTGEEDLAARWQIPVLTIQKILVVNTNAVPEKTYLSPRQQQEHRR